jgi:hypothetical protein
MGIVEEVEGRGSQLTSALGLHDEANTVEAARRLRRNCNRRAVD